MQIKVSRAAIKDIDGFIGVYIFKKRGRPIYIGKSLNIKARLLSHLENSKIHPKERILLENSTEIECIQTDSEFKALVLEARLIKIHRPKYNVRWKDDKSYLYIKTALKDPYPKILLSRKEDDKKSVYFGPFSSTQSVHEVLREIRKIFPFCTQKKIGRNPCFYSKIGLCNPCPNGFSKIKDKNLRQKLKGEYKKNIRRIIKLLQGNIESVQSNLYKRLKTLTKNEDYEKAIQVRNLILRLENLAKRQRFDPTDKSSYRQGEKGTKELFQLLHLYFPKLMKVARIECYDISSIGQKQATGSMVVFSEGSPDKSQYRKFRIKNLKSSSDFEMIDEILRRRFKNKWPTPDLLIIDGGKPQVRVMLKVLLSLGISIPTVGIAKNPDRLVLGTENLPTIRPKTHNHGFNIVQHLRDEAHRFAKKYHLKLRENGTFF